MLAAQDHQLAPDPDQLARARIATRHAQARCATLHQPHQATAQVETGAPRGLGSLSLGYFDQAHFIGDFTRLVGRPPGDHARREGPRRGMSNSIAVERRINASRRPPA
ncbi:MAG TPA: hypothetical protein VGU03_02770 [Frateuria sp.]|uniref:hypothetical protein n=1 Tax=Frateuria sp. TaxID=2211372 RepID=UPI002DE2AB41|nr:hypothetical protein [Frateuria sp.]